VGSPRPTANSAGNLTALDIGFRAVNGAHPWNGRIDEAALFNRSLSPEEVAGQFQYGLQSARVHTLALPPEALAVVG